MSDSIDFARISVKVPMETYHSLCDLRTIDGGRRGFNLFVRWVLADWCRREKRRRKAWRKRHGYKNGDFW